MRVFVVVVALAFSIVSTETGRGSQVAPRENLRTFSTNPHRVASFKRAVEVMKARKPSDPTSWFFQAAIHGVSPDYVAAALAIDPDVAKVDQARFWNQCPHSGQGSADFLIWHRAYLFYFERILRDASGDPNLSVPYWAYDRGDGGFPAIFGDPDPDPVTNVPRNPLFDVQREAAFVFGLYELSPGAVSTSAVDAERHFFGPLDMQGLAGSVADEDPGTQGVLERRPHNSIHFAVGGAIGNTAGSMSDVSTAAFDPIFWVHHANIDRLWSEWDCGEQRSWGAVPPRAWLDEKPWVFHDVDRSIKGASRSEYLEYSTIGVAYDTDKPGCKRLSETSPVPRDLTDSNPARQPFRVAKKHVIATSAARIALSGSRPVTQELEVSNRPIFGAPNLRAALSATDTRRRVLLELRGISYDTPPSVGYDVYINVPAGTRLDHSVPGYVGNLALFGIKHHDTTSPNVQSFDVTDIITKDGKDVTVVTVTIVPFELLRARGRGTGPALRSGNVSIDSLSVIVADGRQ